MTKNYYVNGNTVRELEAPARRDPRTRREIEEARRRKNRRNAARRNRQRAMEMNKGFVAFLSVCAVVVTLSAVMYVKMQAQLTNRMNSVANLEGQLNDLRADNDARYKSITTSVDFNHIKDVAINQLGMSYPKEDQVVYYSIDNNNFMDQYSDIPKK